jgi:hypothetical protein
MTNRHDRRTTRKRGALIIHYGHLDPRDPNYGLPMDCYACGATHSASGAACIEGQSTIHVPLCEVCLASDEAEKVVVRKFLNAPDLKIREGGETTTEQFIALAEKLDSTEQ